MEFKRISIDTSKHVFTIHGVDEQERPVLRREIKRAQVEPFFAKLAANGGGSRSLRRFAPLGAGARKHGPPGEVDPAAIRETVREAEQERPQRCGGNQ